MMGSFTAETLKKEVEVQIQKHFPSEDIQRLVELVERIFENKQLITVYRADLDGTEEFDTIILKALFKGIQVHDPLKFVSQVDRVFRSWDIMLMLYRTL
eukprot:g38968.t1